MICTAKHNNCISPYTQRPFNPYLYIPKTSLEIVVTHHEEHYTTLKLAKNNQRNPASKVCFSFFPRQIKRSSLP